MENNTPKGDRIAKVMARAGLASRREAERMIAAGRVTVNGRKIDSPALNVTPSDKIVVDGKEVGEPDVMRLWLYHKPRGLVTTTSDEKGRDTVFDALPDTLPRVMSIGRLDLNSEGLLILTNDGEVKRKLELPTTGWVRRYRVRVNGRPNDETLEPLRKGVVHEGERFQPMEVKYDRQQGANAWVTIGIREGKNREIRRAMEVVGLKVNRLIRISYGPFQLRDIKPGAVEEVKQRVVREQLGLEAAASQKPVRNRRVRR
ncbi:MAG: pseudouridine synthase [Paracoccaceae bacterium]